MLNTNQKIKIVYSLRMHIALQQLGFVCLQEMKNPQNQFLNCWVYEDTPEFKKEFNKLIKEGRHE